MATAYQCDRCKQYFTVPEEVNSSNFPFTCIFGRTEQIKTCVTVYSDIAQLNLCPGCLAALNYFLREGEPKKVKKNTFKKLFTKKEKN